MKAFSVLGNARLTPRIHREGSEMVEGRLRMPALRYAPFGRYSDPMRRFGDRRYGVGVMNPHEEIWDAPEERDRGAGRIGA